MAKINEKTVRCAKFFEVFREVFRRRRPREKFFDRANILEFMPGASAIETIEKSWKSEPSWRFFGRLKFRPFDFVFDFLIFLPETVPREHLLVRVPDRHRRHPLS